MSYQSPIEVIATQMRVTSETRLGEEIVKAVQNVGVNVDKAELLKALRYDRGQYQKGHKDRDNELVRCKDCGIRGKGIACHYSTGDEWFCADGVPRDGE